MGFFRRDHKQYRFLFSRQSLVVIALVVAASLFLFRYSQFSEIEPRSDQAFFTWWVQGLVQADHLLPKPDIGESWLAALERDSEATLHRMLRPMYSKAVTVLTSVPLLFRSIAAVFFGGGLEVQIASSVFAASGVVFVLALFPVFAGFGRNTGRFHPGRFTEFSLILFFAVTTAYLHVFSPWGNHNFGVFSLVVAAVVGQRAFSKIAEGAGIQRFDLWVFFLAQILALYSHWTNVFLLPVAIVLMILTEAGMPWRRRTVWVAAYAGFVFVAFIPFVAVMAVEALRELNPNAHTVSGLAELAIMDSAGNWLLGAGKRAIDWFSVAGKLFSWPGTFLGLAGILSLAWTRRQRLPMAILFVHFAVWCALPIFAGAYLRTFVYALPFLALGLAVACLQAIGWLWAYSAREGTWIWGGAGVVVLALGIWHMVEQAPTILDVERLERRNPDVWAMYYQGQGTLRPVMSEIDRLVPSDAAVITWSYGPQFLLRNFGLEKHGRTVVPTLLNLLRRDKSGDLYRYLNGIGMTLTKQRSIYVLIDWESDQTSPTMVEGAVDTVLGSRGFGLGKVWNLETIGTWKLPSSWPRHLALFRVQVSDFAPVSNVRS